MPDIFQSRSFQEFARYPDPPRRRKLLKAVATTVLGGTVLAGGIGACVALTLTTPFAGTASLAAAGVTFVAGVVVGGGILTKGIMGITGYYQQRNKAAAARKSVALELGNVQEPVIAQEYARRQREEREHYRNIDALATQTIAAMKERGVKFSSNYWSRLFFDRASKKDVRRYLLNCFSSFSHNYRRGQNEFANIIDNFANRRHMAVGIATALIAAAPRQAGWIKWLSKKEQETPCIGLRDNLDQRAGPRIAVENALSGSISHLREQAAAQPQLPVEPNVPVPQPAIPVTKPLSSQSQSQSQSQPQPQVQSPQPAGQVAKLLEEAINYVVESAIAKMHVKNVEFSSGYYLREWSTDKAAEETVRQQVALHLKNYTEKLSPSDAKQWMRLLKDGSKRDYLATRIMETLVPDTVEMPWQPLLRPVTIPSQNYVSYAALMQGHAIHGVANAALAQSKWTLPLREEHIIRVPQYSSSRSTSQGWEEWLQKHDISGKSVAESVVEKG